MKNKFLCAFFLILLLGCSQGTDTKPLDNATSGEVTISVDESFFPLADAEIKVFQSIYKRAHVNVNYKPEAEVIQDLLEDSVRIVIAARQLNQDETSVLEKATIIPQTTKIAIDAVAIISNKENLKDTLSISQLTQILQGKINKWKELDENSSLGDIQVVFDNKNSSIARYIKEKFLGNQNFQDNTFALHSTPEIIEHVKKNPSALGIMGVSWISDKADTLSNSFLKDITVVALTDSIGNDAYEPYQAYIAQKKYPLCRDIFIISREARAGLGTGFAAFVAGDKGQRIVLKSGLVPATMPVRIVGFRE